MGDTPNDPREQQAQQGISFKFLSCRNGPYAIRARTGSTSYELDCLDTLPRAIGIYDVSQLQPYHGLIEIPPSSGRPRRYIWSEGETVGKFKYYPLRPMGGKNASHYYPRGVASSILRHYASSQSPLVKLSRRRHIINRRQNGANRRL
jgi:hypothetical protein